MMSTARMQRANGALELGYIAEHGVTRLTHLFQSDPCRALFPRGELDDVNQTVVLTTSGGLAGGDRIRAQVRCGPGARQLVTPQAAEKVYRTINAATEIDLELKVEDGAWLEYVPQETILFNRSQLRRQVRIDVAGSGALLAGDILSFGRVAHGESYAEGVLFDCWEVRRSGRLAWADRLRLDDPKRALAHPAGFGTARAYGTILYVGSDPSRYLAATRAAVEAPAGRVGASVVNGVLLVRLMGGTTAQVRADYARIWTCLRRSVAGLPPRMPRIWHS